MLKSPGGCTVQIDGSHFEGIVRTITNYLNEGEQNLILVINQETETYQLIGENEEIINEYPF